MAVLEVGLGGRFDATNVVDPRSGPGTSPFSKVVGQHNRGGRIVSPVYEDCRRLADNFQSTFPRDMLQPGANRFFRDYQASLPGQFD